MILGKRMQEALLMSTFHESQIHPRTLIESKMFELLYSHTRFKEQY